METMYIAGADIQLTYADTDMMGVIYHGNYLKWFELGRSQLIQDIGYDYLAAERAGYYAPVYNVELTYKKAVHLGDKISVRTWVQENNGIKVVYGYQIVNDEGDVHAEGTTTHIIVRKDTFKPVQFKKAFPEWFAKYEEIKRK